jgi:glycosyltransferase involved in cell wall biosynthesis
VVESMACAVPCIASNVGDMEDLIKDGINGYLVNDYFNNTEFVEKALRLLNNFDIYEKCSQNALIMARDKFSHKAASKVWDEIFHNIGVI